jgi:hypothetical protein
VEGQSFSNEEDENRTALVVLRQKMKKAVGQSSWPRGKNQDQEPMAERK